MSTQFERLNSDWNAHPVDPDVVLEIDGATLRFEFALNNLRFSRFTESQRALLTFRDCAQYRMGRTNDEGWYRGQCRFSGIAPGWGEFYEVTGDSMLEQSPNDWINVEMGRGTRHFLFYMKDDTFECVAGEYAFLENAG